MQPSTAYVYVVRCRDGTLYTGWTTDLRRRLAAHNAGRGARYTRSRRPVELVYAEPQPDRRSAMRRETVIKNLNRDAKLALIEQADLSSFPLDQANDLPFRAILHHWLRQPDDFLLAALAQLLAAASPLPFYPAMLEVDRTLWGTFWQGDVIAPGYLLPALELSYLRAVHLDETNDASTPQHYLQQLQQTLTQPPTGIWIGKLETAPVLVLGFAEPYGSIIWLAEGVILTSYRDIFQVSPGYGLTSLLPSSPPTPVADPPDIDLNRLLELRPELPDSWSGLNQAARLDRLIQLHRAYSHLRNSAEGEALAAWFVGHG